MCVFFLFFILIFFVRVAVKIEMFPLRDSTTISFSLEMCPSPPRECVLALSCLFFLHPYILLYQWSFSFHSPLSIFFPTPTSLIIPSLPMCFVLPPINSPPPPAVSFLPPPRVLSPSPLRQDTTHPWWRMAGPHRKFWLFLPKLRETPIAPVTCVMWWLCCHLSPLSLFSTMRTRRGIVLTHTHIHIHHSLSPSHCED